MSCLTVLKQSLSVLLKCPVETKTIRKDGIDMDLPTANGKIFIDAIAAFRQTIKQIEQAKPVAWRWKYKFKDIGETGAYEYHSHEFASINHMQNGEPLYLHPPTETLTTEMLIEAALSASAAGLLSGTTNWAAYVLQYLKGESL